MTPSLQIHHNRKRHQRAMRYLDLMEKCKELHRSFMRDYRCYEMEGAFDKVIPALTTANKYARLHTFLTDRYNQTVCDSLIIAPFDLEPKTTQP